ncbi:glycosyltransferase family 4 protein [Flavobacterium croceum]|uniref:glycosyltransferase family 4 protein n=1 Tax=Flavobacterium croceum TaxID=370975 RepID=UPI0024A91F32|nr:glycosyltransferase family 4 protein [Flavobacterium croceum]
MKNILFIHQSAELYGSDKTLLLLLKNINTQSFNPVVVLPNEGPLKKELESLNITVVIAPVLKLSRKMFTLKNIIAFLKDIKKGFKALDKLNSIYSFDLIYSNTLAVLLGLFYAKKRKIKHLWHVHEIIESPKVFSNLFCFLLKNKSNTQIVYNSIATQNFWNRNNTVSKKSMVIWNGIENNIISISNSEKENLRKHVLNTDSNEVLIGLVGRISRWKGQLLLLNAFKEIVKKTNHVKLVFIGSAPPNQEHFFTDLTDYIEKYKLNNFVKIIPFQKDIEKFWKCIDIAVVASTEPEPFGLVAVEAMMAKKPVVGANHGGLSEIIVNNETGFLVKPNEVNELAKALQILIKDGVLRTKLGDQGYQRALQEFSVAAYVEKFETLLASL